MKRNSNCLETPHPRGAQAGQSTVEFIMTFGLVVFLIVAVVQISLICSTKIITNYAAWIAARVWAVNEDSPNDKARNAAKAVLGALDWGSGGGAVNIQEDNEGVEVSYRTPLGIPFVLTNDTAHRVTTLGWGSVPLSPLRDEDEAGDNREPDGD